MDLLALIPTFVVAVVLIWSAARRRLDAVTGAVLVGLGVRVAVGSR